MFTRVLIPLACLLVAASCQKEKFAVGNDVPTPVPAFETTVVLPSALGKVNTDQKNARGETIGIPCSTCHEIGLGGDVPARKAHELKDFHKDMIFSHGTLDCQSCHHPTDRDQLRLANGDSLAFADTLQLCGQCHGAQLRDFNDGAHGGMNGYWDLSKGPRTRNSCMHCHDVHSPAFPQAMPVFPPKDRFLTNEKHHE